LIGSRGRQPTTWPSITATEDTPFPLALGAAVVAGVAIALSLPPFGWWPLGVAGLAAFAALLYRRGPGRRAMVGAAVGLGQYAIGLWWVTEFNGAGFVVLLLLAMAGTAAAAALVVSRRWLAVLVGLPAALMASDWVRGHFPFGGLPLGGIALGQAAGPLAPVARLGGPLLVTGVAAAAGTALAVLAAAGLGRRRRQPSQGEKAGHAPAAAADARKRRSVARDRVAAGVQLVVVVALVAAGRLGPNGGGGGSHRTILVAAVQGGGTRGLNASQVDPDVVFRRHLDATAALRPPLDLVVWPEDVVQVSQPIGQTPQAAAIGQLARRLGTTIVAGVVEDVGAHRFRNAAVAWNPSGVIVARYDKVHRVPFGEYIPGREVFQHLANLDLVPRDAIAGRGPGLLDTPAGPLGTVISYEVFFEDRTRAAMAAGGELLVVPTNASSYRTSQVPSQEVAAAQLRAWETGRDTVQAAPTGYTALIDHDGRVLARSPLGRRQVITGRLTLRHGRTLFVRLGDIPALVLALLGLVAPIRRAPGPG
jgi:apolipoprotein N-acyltransferase